VFVVRLSTKKNIYEKISKANGVTGKWPVDSKPAVESVTGWAAVSNNDYFGHLAVVASISNKGNTQEESMR